MNFENFWLNSFWSLAPSIGIGVMFWLVVRAVIRADRGERKAYARIEAQLRAELAGEQPRGRAQKRKRKQAPGQSEQPEQPSGRELSDRG